MSNRSLHDDARAYFVPFLLGSNRVSHTLSRKIFFRYGIESFVLDKKRSLYDILDISSNFCHIVCEGNRTLLCQQLIALSCREPYTLPLLIPTSSQYASVIGEQAELLERYFVLCKAESFFNDSPIADILQKHERR